MFGFTKTDYWTWPSELTQATYPKAAKAGKIELVLGSLGAAEKQKDGMNIPFIPGSGAKPLWDKWEKDAEVFVAGPLKKLHTTLILLRKRVTNAQADKEVVKDKDCKAALTAIGDACDKLAKEIDPSKFDTKVEAARKAGEAAKLEFATRMVSPAVKAWQSVSSKGHTEIAEAKKLLLAANGAANQAEQLQSCGAALHKGARNMTQNIANILKFQAEKVLVPGLADSDYTAMAKMLKTLIPIANSQSDWTGGDVKTAALGVKTVGAHTPMYDQIGAKMKG